MKQRFMSIELERALVYRPNTKSYPPLGTQYGSATPFSFQALLHQLMNQGWEPMFDPTTGVLIRVRKKRPKGPVGSDCWTITSDVTTGILETTLPPQDNLFHLEKEQRYLDKTILPILKHLGLFIWYTETTPVTPASRQYYALFHTYWRGEYAHLRQRGMDHYWFSWTLGNNPSLDVSVQEAIPFLRIILRLTGVTFFFLRSGAISGGKVSPGKMLTVRPWAWKNLFLKSPYTSDADRTGMPAKEITNWHEYFSYLMRFRLLTLFFDDGRPYRISSDPSFFSFWKKPPRAGWSAVAINGQQCQIHQPELINVERLQRQTYISRLRFGFTPKAVFKEFAFAFEDGEISLQDWLMDNMQKLYFEVRSDSCPPKDEEFSTLALYLGLLTNLKESFEYVVNNFTYYFWQKLFSLVPYASIDSKIEDIWIPDLLEAIIELAKRGLRQRGLGEEKYLLPLSNRVHQKTSPAEETLKIFEKEGGGVKAIKALANHSGLF